MAFRSGAVRSRNATEGVPYSGVRVFSWNYESLCMRWKGDSLVDRDARITRPGGKMVAAWLLSLGLLPYMLGRLWKGLLLRGRVDILSVAAMLLGVLAMAALTRRGGGRAATANNGHVPKPGRVLLNLATLLGWLVANAVVANALAGTLGPLLPRVYVILVFVAGSLPLGWLAWMFAWPRPMWRRAAVLVALLPLPVAAGLLLKADGLTGDGRLNFTWRWTAGQRPSPGGHRPIANADLRRGPPIRLIETPDDYPQFLGPRREAVVPGARLAGDWQASPPRTLWRHPIGAGWGSFAVVGGYAFTQEQRGDDECVVCYRLATGEEIWRHADRQSFESTAGLGPRATPTVASRRVFALGATGLLNCLDAPTGRSLWSVNILADQRLAAGGR